MRILARNPVRAVFQQLRDWPARRAVILTYHRVGRAQIDPWGLFVSPEHLRQQLEILSRYACVLPLQEVVLGLREGRLPRRSVAVTFDDGYADWFLTAKPMLEQVGIPATVFLITGATDGKRALWWDELESVLLHLDPLPETLQLCISGRAYSWSLGDAARLQDGQLHASWRASEDPPTARHAIYFTLWQLLRTLGQEERQPIMDELRAWAGQAEARDDRHNLLSVEEIVSLGKSNLFEIGAHSVTHPLLSTMSAARQREEIEQSKSYLERILGRPVVSFAFPYGNSDTETIRMVREAGFACACGTKADIVRPNTNCFELPRLQVQDWQGLTFEKRLSTWFSS